MKDAEISTNKKEINLPKIQLPIDENKLKQLEARIIGPSSDGNMPFEYQPLIDVDVEHIKSRFSNKSENNTQNDHPNKELNITKNLNETFQSFTANLNSANIQLIVDNNSNKSIANSNKKKNTPKRAEKKTKLKGGLQIDYLSIKRNRGDGSTDETEIMRNLRGEIRSDLRDHETNNQENNLGINEENIEFSSKNIVANTPLFSKTNSVMNNFLNRSNNNLNNKLIKSEPKLPVPRSQTPNEKIYIQTSLNNKNPATTNNSYTNLAVLQSPDGRSIKSIIEENEKLKKDLSEKEKTIKSLTSNNEDYVRNISLMTKQFENQTQMSKFSMIKVLRELEELKRNNKKKWLNEQEYRLGRFNLQRVGQTVIDVWENGEEFIKLTNKLREIECEKDKLEKQKKNLASFIKKRNPNSVLDGEITNENELNDMRELINFKISLYQKEESEIREMINKLEIEKIGILLEKKRLKEEESSRFRGVQSKEKFPILAGRYLILSLLGKGGYSEVYKAYDLENNMEVACKIHQLNPQWSDNIKDNYIRHTIRENQIHKEIVHSKIVRHYDTIEIDLSSFCTVLELCTGPDLHTYLKMHKQLPEKEARGIICQILSGLEYLNKLQKKIIHYDLKPQNIILHNMEVKISDFGLSKIVESNCENIELTSQGVGTYWYLPPECFDTSRNPPGISSKVDIWSLGVILYELIYGVRPFGHNYTQDKILQEGVILNATTLEFPPKPTISKACQEFIEKCLARKQSERFDVFDALEHEFIKPKKKSG